MSAVHQDLDAKMNTPQLSGPIIAALEITKRTLSARIGNVMKILGKALKRNPNVSEEEIVQFLGLLNVPSRVVDYGEGQMVTNIMVAHAGKHYRGPGTSTYYPPLTGMIPRQSVHLALEGRLNALFVEYSKQYCSKFSENFPAVYLSGENEDVIEGCCLMVIKPPSDKMTGQYHSTHQFVLKKTGADSYKMSHFLTLSVYTKFSLDKGETSLMGHVTSQQTSTINVSSNASFEPQVMKKIEILENKTLHEMKDINFLRATNSIEKMRTLESVTDLLERQKAAQESMKNSLEAASDRFMKGRG